MSEVLFFVSAFVSALVGTAVGFGSSTVFMPLALFFLDFRTALVLVALSHIFSNASRLVFFHRGVDRRMLVLLGAPSLLATVAGAALVAHVSQSLFKLLLGVFLVVFSLFSFTGHVVRVRPTKSNEIVGGFLSGFLAGLIGTGGALRAAFLTSFGMKKNAYIATASAIAIGNDVTRVPVYMAGGFLGQQYYWYIPVLFVLAIAGSYTGKKVVEKIPQRRFRSLVLIALALIALKFVYDGLSTLVA